MTRRMEYTYFSLGLCFRALMGRQRGQRNNGSGGACLYYISLYPGLFFWKEIGLWIYILSVIICIWKWQVLNHPDKLLAQLLITRILLNLCISTLPTLSSIHIWSVFSSKQRLRVESVCVLLSQIGPILCQNQIRQQSSVSIPSLITV